MKVPVIYWGVDIYIDALAPWLYLFDKYWNPEPDSVDLIISGFSYIPDEVKLPDYARFINVGSPHSGNVSEWTGAYMKLLNQIDSEHHVHFTEEFWLTGTVNLSLIHYGLDYMRAHPEVARLDLSGDIMNYAAMSGNKSYKDIFLRGEGSQYRVSCQVGIWRKTYLLEVMREGDSPWQFEMDGSRRMKTMCSNGVEILGADSIAVPYQNEGVYKIRAFPNVVCLSSFSLNDILEMVRRGLIDTEKYEVTRMTWEELREWRTMFKKE